MKENKCEHAIGMEWEYDYGFLVDEEDVTQSIKDRVNELAYDKSALNYSLKDILYYSSCYYRFEYFTYCPDCGCKINKRQISAKLNKIVKDEILRLDAEGKLETIKEKKLKKEKKQNENKTAMGYVYLVKLGDYYKIGISKKPNERLGEFTLLPTELEQIFVINVYGYKFVEKELHEYFDKKRVRGEWFSLEENDIEFIKNYLMERKV